MGHYTLASGSMLGTSLAAAKFDPVQDFLSQMGAQHASPAVMSLVALTLLSFIPLLIIAMTSFTRIAIVLSILRNALGLQQTPPNSVLLVLALFLTLFTMTPVIQKATENGLNPYLEHKASLPEAVAAGIAPFKLFMIRQTRQKDLVAVLHMAKRQVPKSVGEIELVQLVPAFMLSELRTAFQIGFVIFLPFVLIDLVVAAILMALGMIMLPPTTISLPLKILLFLLIDGWSLVSSALLASYH